MLRKFAAILLSLIFATTLFATSNFPLNYQYTDSNVTVTFPTPDVPNEVDVELETGTAVLVEGQPPANYTGSLTLLETKGGQATFGYAVLDYDTAVGVDAATLDAAINGAFAASGSIAAENTRKSATLAGAPAREAGGTNGTVDVFLRISDVGNRRYIATVVTETSLHLTAADADEFFDSIRPMLKPLKYRA